MTKPFLAIPPSASVEREVWRVLTHEAESGFEQRTAKWTHPRREWDLSWGPVAHRAETEYIRDLLHESYGAGMSFYFREPNKTSRRNVFIGTGTGSRTSWVFPVQSYDTATIRANSAVVAYYNIYVGSANAGTLNQLVIDTPVNTGTIVTVDYTYGHYIPIVRLIDQFQYTPHPWSYDFGTFSFNVRETKEEYPEE